MQEASNGLWPALSYSATPSSNSYVVRGRCSSQAVVRKEEKKSPLMPDIFFLEASCLLYFCRLADQLYTKEQKHHVEFLQEA